MLNSSVVATASRSPKRVHASARAAAVTTSHVLAAADRLRGRVTRTPLVRSSTFDGYLKLESQQITGAYKVRGALNALMVQVSRGDCRPVVAASAGNHAAGVAWAGRRLGLDVITVVPEGAPASKIERTERYGAEVIRCGQRFDDAFAEAQRLAQANDWRFLHAFDDPDVIAGQGSLAVELDDFCPDVVAVPIGGGGLASGVATYLHQRGVRVVGVQVRGVDAMAQALGVAPRGPIRDTIADGVAVRQAGALTADICHRLLDDLILVSEAEVRDAMRRLYVDDYVIAEGAGAVAAAALDRIRGRRKVAVVSGGNVDLATLTSALISTPAAPEPPRGALALSA